MMQPVYLAGPFFNSAQLVHISRIEQEFDHHRLPYFSPRKENAQDLKTREGRQAILKKNVQGLKECSFVLAILDWLMPNDHKVQVVHYAGNCWEEAEVIADLNIPDSGTVWEMGCCYPLNIPVFGFVKEAGGKSNLMLTESMVGVIYGFDKLFEALEALKRAEGLPLIPLTVLQPYCREWRGVIE